MNAELCIPAMHFLPSFSTYTALALDTCAYSLDCMATNAVPMESIGYHRLDSLLYKPASRSIYRINLPPSAPTSAAPSSLPWSPCSMPPEMASSSRG